MSQHDCDITTADANTGSTFRAQVNAALQALASCFSGATEPVFKYAGMFWFDTTTGKLKQRTPANSGWNVLWDMSIADLSAYLLNAANLTGTIDAARLPAIPLALIPATLTGKDADTLDGQHGTYYRNADQVDGFHASQTPTANTIPVLDAEARIPWVVKPAYRGALAYNSTATAAGAAFSFASTAYNSDTIWASGAPTRLTVPSGITRVRVTGQAKVPIIANSAAALRILKNNSTYPGLPSARLAQNISGTVTDIYLNIASPVLPVTGGDYFELSNASSNQAEADSYGVNTWFALEIVA